MITATKIGKLYNMEAKDVNKHLASIGWITKEKENWILTPLGKENGGEQKTYRSNGKQYVEWTDQILQHPKITTLSGKTTNTKLPKQSLLPPSIKLQGINTFNTPTEKKFKEHLRRHLPENIEIHCKVRLVDVLHPVIRDIVNTWKHKRYFMRHVDFTLVISETQETILAIELDDKSHSSKKAKIKDAQKIQILTESKVHYARITVDKMHDEDIMKKIIKFCEKRTGTASRSAYKEANTAPALNNQ